MWTDPEGVEQSTMMVMVAGGCPPLSVNRDNPPKARQTKREHRSSNKGHRTIDCYCRPLNNRYMGTRCSALIVVFPNHNPNPLRVQVNVCVYTTMAVATVSNEHRGKTFATTKKLLALQVSVPPSLSPCFLLSVLTHP